MFFLPVTRISFTREFSPVFRRKRQGGSEHPLVPIVFQVSLAQNNHYGKVAHLGIVYSGQPSAGSEIPKHPSLKILILDWGPGIWSLKRSWNWEPLDQNHRKCEPCSDSPVPYLVIKPKSLYNGWGLICNCSGTCEKLGSPQQLLSQETKPLCGEGVCFDTSLATR